MGTAIDASGSGSSTSTAASSSGTSAGTGSGTSAGASTSSTDGPAGSSGETTAAESSSGGESSSGSSSGGEASTFIAVTFNTGGHADGEEDTADDWYGNGLSWIPAVEQTRLWLEELQPDVITFQELFHPPLCAEIPPEFHPGYVCETWQEGDPTVAEMILGPDYQVVCNLGKEDKCAAVKTSFGSFVGCDSSMCLDGLDGAEIDGCGNGSRVGRGVIERTNGERLTVVNFHGTSGFLPEDQLCRVAQIDHLFEDMDGAPAANGETNLILGDFNTDPARALLLDLSAQRLGNFVGDNLPFYWITDVGDDATPTYAGIFNIDHQASDTYVGECWHPGISPGYPAVVDFDYFDHVPAVCELSLPG